MENTIVPEGYNTISPYLLLIGADAFITFAKQVFNAEERERHKRDETTIMHAELKIGNSIIMLADANEQWKTLTSSLFIYVPNADETYAKALAAGASSVMPLSDQNYGRTCGVKDPFGNVWWITSVA